MSHRRSVIQTTAAVIGLAATVAACASPPPPAAHQDRFVLGIENQSHSVAFALGSIEMDAEEYDALNTFVDGLEPAERSSVTLKASDIRAQDRVSRVARAFVGEDVDLRHDYDDRPFGKVAIEVEQEIVRTGVCPPPSRDFRRPDTEVPVGCLNDYMLFDMVEDRRDLVRSRDAGPAPSAPAAALARAIDGNRVSSFRAGSQLGTGSRSKADHDFPDGLDPVLEEALGEMVGAEY